MGGISGASLQELRSNEKTLRTAFKRYEVLPGFLLRKDLPALFRDVGLELGVDDDLGLTGSNRLHMFVTSELKDTTSNEELISIHRVIELQNKYITTLEEAKAQCKPLDKDIASKGGIKRPSSAMRRQAALEQKVAIVDEFAAALAASSARAKEAALTDAERDEQARWKAEAHAINFWEKEGFQCID